MVPLDTTIARRATELAIANKLAIADAIIYATAEQFGADLLTCDAHFRELHDVIYIDKRI